MIPKIVKKATVQLPGTNTLAVGVMRELLDGFEDDAILRIRYTNFDNSRDPREHSYVTLEVSFD